MERKKIFIDASGFKYPAEISQAVKIELSLSEKYKFFINGNKEDFVNQTDKENVILLEDNEELLKDIRFKISAIDNFDGEFDSNSSFIRLAGTEKKKDKFYVQVDKNITEEEFDNLYQKCLYFYPFLTSKAEESISTALIKSKDDLSHLETLLKNKEKYNGLIEIKDIIKNEANIIFVDNITSYYMFNLMQVFNELTIKEHYENKTIKNLIKPFKKDKIDREVLDMNSFFSYFTFKFNNDYTEILVRSPVDFNAFYYILFLLDQFEKTNYI